MLRSGTERETTSVALRSIVTPLPLPHGKNISFCKEIKINQNRKNLLFLSRFESDAELNSEKNLFISYHFTGH